jgi:hypothetical protein
MAQVPHHYFHSHNYQEMFRNPLMVDPEVIVNGSTLSLTSPSFQGVKLTGLSTADTSPAKFLYLNGTNDIVVSSNAITTPALDTKLDSYVNQAVKTTSSPTFAGLTLTPTIAVDANSVKVMTLNASNQVRTTTFQNLVGIYGHKFYTIVFGTTASGAVSSVEGIGSNLVDGGYFVFGEAIAFNPSTSATSTFRLTGRISKVAGSFGPYTSMENVQSIDASMAGIDFTIGPGVSSTNELRYRLVNIVGPSLNWRGLISYIVVT